MSRVAVTTVITARPWEEALTEELSSAARLRLVTRVSHPVEVLRAIPASDVLIVGAETPWLESWVLDTVVSMGTATIGIHPPGDAPGADLVAAASLVFPDTVSTDRLIATASVLGVAR